MPIDPHPASLANPADPYHRLAQTFPRLTPPMVGRALAYGATLEIRDDTVLFERGERHVAFHVVLAGEVEIHQEDALGATRVLTVHGAGEFTGELDLLGGSVNLVTAIARAPARVLRVERDGFRMLTAAEPDIGELVVRALILRRMGFVEHEQGGALLVGSPHSAEMSELRRFLIRNHYPHRLLDTQAEPDASRVLLELDLSPRDLPAMILPGLPPLRRPGIAALSDALGLTEDVETGVLHDVAVVGAGPAGLAAAVYAASEGLDTIVVEGLAPGGQAGTSSRIENYLGFPTGISGHALAGRAQVQAQKFGARLLISRPAIALDRDDAGGGYSLTLSDGRALRARTVVVATGARYRRLDLEDLARFEGQGVHYAATPMEAQLCARQQVMVVGGGNSAGQAAVFLSRHVAHVHVVVRGAGLAETMSDYLVQRIALSSTITVHVRSEIAALEGETSLARVTCRHRDTGTLRSHDIGNLFVMIGAEPNTGWLGACVRTDRGGFVCTGPVDTGRPDASAYETSAPGVFAVGDVRAGSVKRVAAGVGEGSVVVQAIHRALEAA